MSKIRNPAAVAAAIGRKKYGKAKFQKMAAAGKRHKSHSSMKPGGGGRFKHVVAMIRGRR